MTDNQQFTTELNHAHGEAAPATPDSRAGFDNQQLRQTLSGRSDSQAQEQALQKVRQQQLQEQLRRQRQAEDAAKLQATQTAIQELIALQSQASTALDRQTQQDIAGLQQAMSEAQRPPSPTKSDSAWQRFNRLGHSFSQTTRHWLQRKASHAVHHPQSHPDHASSTTTNPVDSFEQSSSTQNLG